MRAKATWAAGAGMILAIALGRTAIPNPGDNVTIPPVEGDAAGAALRGSAATPAAALEAFRNLPLRFEENRGQAGPEVKFLARGSDSGLYLTAGGAVFVFGGRAVAAAEDEPGDRPASPTVVRMEFLGANPDPEVAGVEPLRGKISYFRGDDPSRWRTNVPTFGRVVYRDLYPGIDLAYYAKGPQLEYDLIVAPGAVARVRWLKGSGDIAD